MLLWFQQNSKEQRNNQAVVIGGFQLLQKPASVVSKANNIFIILQ